MESDSSIEAMPPEASGEIIARPGRYYRWTRYIISIGLLMGYGSFFIRDGFFIWPRELRQAEELESQGRHALVKPHSEMDIRINRAIGMTVPPLGLALLVWTLYNSRGQYRLAGTTLYVPGHPPVPLDSILKIDKTLWDRKGIAYIEYAPEGSDVSEPAAPETIRLDDFVYEQTQTDAILERIERIIAPETEQNNEQRTLNEATNEES